MRTKINRIFFIMNRFVYLLKALSKIDKKLDDIHLNQGRIIELIKKGFPNKSVNLSEYKIFSQNGEDGLIQTLVDLLKIKNKTFVEFGVEDFFESNCRYLMQKDGWKGFVIDGSESNIKFLKNSYVYQSFQLEAVCQFITCENINSLIKSSGYSDSLGILSIDIDGNDYWIFECIECKPDLIICEFNPILEKYGPVSVPYDPLFVRSKMHYSNVYYGASLQAIDYIACKKGYRLVAISSKGSNAFFVKMDQLVDVLPTVDVAVACKKSYSRESRNEDGSLSYISNDDISEVLKGLPLVDVINKIRVNI